MGSKVLSGGSNWARGKGDSLTDLLHASSRHPPIEAPRHCRRRREIELQAKQAECFTSSEQLEPLLLLFQRCRKAKDEVKRLKEK